MVNKASALLVAGLGLGFVFLGAILGVPWSLVVGLPLFGFGCGKFGYCLGLGRPLKVISLSEVGLGYVIQWHTTSMSRGSTIYLLTPPGAKDVRPLLPIYVEQLI